MKSALLASLLVLSFSALADKGRITSVETYEVTGAVPKMLKGGEVEGANGGIVVPEVKPDRVEQVGKVISTARDFVALGEAIYELVKKGKPTNVTEYAPLSVVPRDPMSKEVIDPFELEGFSMPVQKRFTTIMKSGAKEAIKFEYMLTYSYGGSYNGTGKWITGAQIIPLSVKTNFGWDFNASMKMAGMMNHGTKIDPVAGLMMTVKYQMNSWSSAEERNDTFHIMGSGEVKTYMKK